MQNKPLYYYSQSGVIPYVRKNGRPMVMLITTRKKKKWTLPKGIIEPGYSPTASAAKEAFEEAGVRGKIYGQRFDYFEYYKWGGTCTVDVFLMEVDEMLEQWPEKDDRQRTLVDPCQAPGLIGREAIKPVLEHFCREQARWPVH